MYEQAGAVIPMRRWLTRAVGILLGIATTRPVMGVFFATSRFTHLKPNQFFGIAFWIGFSLNTIILEMWLRAVDRRNGDRFALWDFSKSYQPVRKA